MNVRFVNPEGLAKGSYSHVAVVSGGRTLYVSGQVAADASGAPISGSFADQVTKVFENLRIALAAEGAGFEHIVKMNIYICAVDAERVATFREIRSRFLGRHQPASTLIDTRALVHPDFQVEVEVIAVVD